MMMRLVLLSLSLLALAVPAEAGSFSPPQGCTLSMTVQSRACRVSNYYTCTQDAPGEQWRSDFDQEGIYFSSKIDAEAQWIESYDLPESVIQRLDANPDDPASFSELLSTGTDTFAFGLNRDNGERTRVSGFDRLTGRSFDIDGIALKETEFEFTETDPAGNILRQSRGHEYINREMRMFFSGPSEWNGGDGTFLPIDGSPREFIFPGEPGFAATQPIFDCDATLSRATPEGSTPAFPSAAKEPAHDNL